MGKQRTVNRHDLEALSAFHHLDETTRTRLRTTIDPNDEAAVKQAIREYVLPTLKKARGGRSRQASLRRTLKYYLTKGNLGGLDFADDQGIFEDIYHAREPAFMFPDNHMDYYRWAWEVFFPGENYRLDSLDNYIEVNRPCRPAPDPYPLRDVPFWDRMEFNPLIALITWPFRLPFDWLQQRRENAAFRQGIAAAWAYCETIWDQPHVHVWHQLIRTPSRPSAPHATMLCDRLAKEFPELAEFVKSKWHDEDPRMAAYAVLCTLDPNMITADVLNRRESIRLRDWYWERTMPLGEWARQRIENHNDAVGMLDE